MFGDPKLTKLTNENFIFDFSILKCYKLFAQNKPDWENFEVFAVNKDNTQYRVTLCQ